MNTIIGAYEAKRRLPELLRQVDAGKSFTITHRGHAIAELVPIGGTNRNASRGAARQMSAFMHSQQIKGVDIRALLEEGRH